MTGDSRLWFFSIGIYCTGCSENVVRSLLYLNINFIVFSVDNDERISVYSGDTGCSFNIVFFYLKFWIFLNSASSASALVFYLPCVCTPREKRERPETGIFQNFRKKTQYLMNTLYVTSSRNQVSIATQFAPFTNLTTSLPASPSTPAS